MAAINIALYSTVIQANMYKNNPFLGLCTDHSEFVSYFGSDGSKKGAAVVHVPAAGLAQTTTVNRPLSSYPITAANRVDFDLTYNLSYVDAGLTYLQEIDAETVAYSKADSIVKEMMAAVAATAGNLIAYTIAPSATTYGVTRVIRTNGASQSVALSSGATGSRSGLTLNNIQAAQNMLDSDIAPYEDRFMMFPSSQWNLEINSLANISQFLQGGSKTPLRFGTIDEITPEEFVRGHVGELYGFNCYKRVTTVSYLTGSTPVLQTVNSNTGEILSTNTTDNLAVLFWQRSGVSVAMGQTALFYNPNRAEYQGDIFSCYVRFGAAQTRSAMPTGQLFIGAIVQQ